MGAAERRVVVGPSLRAVAFHAARTLKNVVADATGARVRVAFSGGSTPTALYEMLVEKFRRAIPWERLEVFFGDERAVGPEDSLSNYRLAREHLLDHIPVPPEQVHRMPADAADLDASARRYEESIRARVPAVHGAVPVFDLIWLGLGADGHTASLFPASAALEERERLVVASSGPEPETERMTFTFPLLAAARWVQFLVTGAGKAGVVNEILSRAESADAYPASRVHAAEVTEWVLDAEAARELTRDLYAAME